MNNSEKEFQKFDWEGITFPIILKQLKSVTNHYDIPDGSELTIWRDRDYRLVGEITGVSADKDFLEYKEDEKIKEVGFISGETLKGKSDNEEYLVEGFGIEYKEIPGDYFDEKLRFRFSCKVYLEKIQTTQVPNTKPKIITDWYLCSLPRLLFGHRTSRYESYSKYKIRNGIDDPIENDDEYRKERYSSSWDFIIVTHGDQEIILQKTPENYLPAETGGISIEYRVNDSSRVTSDFRKMFGEYISFIFGTHLQKIGASEFDKENKILSYESQNPWKRNFKKGRNINPVPLKNGSDRDILELQVNRLLPNFIKLYEKISLSDCLWSLWIGSELPVGSNLPIIASGFEVLINSYLETNNLIKKYTKTEKRDYQNVIRKELESLQEKLSSYDFAPFVLNKIKNPYNLGIGEKFKVFFNSIALDFDKNSIENKALKARNLMTHGTLSFETEEKIRETAKISDAYITLVNRVILKLLDYNWYYIDYSKEGIRYLKMDENM